MENHRVEPTQPTDITPIYPNNVVFSALKIRHLNH